jgi:hypothetical protein
VTALRLVWPSLARASLLLLAAVCLGLLVLLVPINLRIVYQDWAFVQGYPVVAAWLSRPAFAAYWLARDYALALLCTLTGLLLAWRRPVDRAAWLAGVLLITVPVLFNLGGYTETWGYYPPAWRQWLVWTHDVVSMAAIQSLLFFVFLFPNGRPVTRWLGWLAVLFAGLGLLLSLWQALTDAEALFTLYLTTLFLALPVGIAGQVYRYLRQSTRLERQQTKWVVVGLLLWLVILIASLVLIGLGGESSWQGLVALITEHMLVIALASIPLTLAVSVLRYRL